MTATERATKAFDDIMEAGWRGFDFRDVLAKNPKALEAAEALAEELKPLLTEMRAPVEMTDMVNPNA